MSTVISITPPALSVVNNQIVISVGNQGAQGAPGRGILPGGTETRLLAKASDANYDTHWVDPQAATNIGVVAVAGETISALRIVYTEPATGKIFYADKDTSNTISSLLGVTTTAGILDDNINITISGTISDSSWNWNMAGNVNLFLGANGAIVQGALSGAVVVRIGYAISSTKIMVRIGETVLT
jgi:hypothetical protein